MTNIQPDRDSGTSEFRATTGSIEPLGQCWKGTVTLYYVRTLRPAKHDQQKISQMSTNIGFKYEYNYFFNMDVFFPTPT